MVDIFTSDDTASMFKSLAEQMGLETKNEVIKELNTGSWKVVRVKNESSDFLYSDTISRYVKLDLGLNADKALKATGCKMQLKNGALTKISLPVVAEQEVVFFRENHSMNRSELSSRYEARGLVPCDLITLAKVNQDDFKFAEMYPNAAQWKGDDGNFYSVIFRKLDGGRNIIIDYAPIEWKVGWCFAGIRK